MDLLALFLVPDFDNVIHGFITIPSALAEISMVLYLLVLGVMATKPVARIPSQPSQPSAFPPWHKRYRTLSGAGNLPGSTTEPVVMCTVLSMTTFVKQHKSA